MAVDLGRDPRTRSGALRRIGEQLGVNPETLRNWVQQAEVDAELARGEGEDDRSLQTWRVGHEAYFRRSLAARGAVFDATAPLVLERFELTYPRPR